MDNRLPDDHTMKAALALAVRAPSVHNTQPWRFRIGERGVRIYLDPTRAHPSTDPDQRDLVLSCGAALHHLRIALAAMGWSAVVHRLPNPADQNHLASIELLRNRPTMTDVALGAAITDRRTDRRNYSSRPLPPGYLGLVTERAAEFGGVIRQAAYKSRDRLVEAMNAAARQHPEDPDYQLELAAWSGRHDTANGVPARDTTPPRTGQEISSRVFTAPRLIDRTREPDYAELLVLGTAADDRLSRLRAGEATSAVLLTATNVGLATCLLTEPLEIPELRKKISLGVLDDATSPQAVIRIGWLPDDTPPLPVAPRRTVDEVLDPFDAGETTAH
ncbi:NAD(P)H nitroreductase [Nocardia sp. NBC_01730]|uniref:Acg family FMN-binding oxidoreductase n=1 Tax=Nocardia sp. NBC_01730 TaxID=2975998 RepID=UPI002E10FEFC|nr:NAD(P)H nitroreductase [Nocardia sp. NBC_01730]